MNRDNEEQRPTSQTLCGALQKEANCKCLVLSVLIYGCLAAVTWCRCANITKIVINFSKYPLKSTRHVSPCDDGYIYIPVAFMGMLYLVYLVECYHSPIRIDLLHGESQDSVLSKLSQLRLAQPTIWWKAVSYHYVRRKRQIVRYRNGDNYTTTQVYYERVNTHAATSFYFYDYCGVKDISKDLVMDPKIPITKINLSKGFAFSNMRSATEFEEARSRFFAEQELRDDYMEMREGLDLGYNFNTSTTLVAVLGRPWFTNTYVYWCLSALLLSWPLRIIIECKTQYANYQVTKLFGVNYDTPSSTQIHASPSQLSAPGSYMLAPSYSEALLMEPAASSSSTSAENGVTSDSDNEMLVPSYSEALLYERAAVASSCPSTSNAITQSDVNNVACTVGRSTTNSSLYAIVENPSTFECNCHCHQLQIHDNNDSNIYYNTSNSNNNNNNNVNNSLRGQSSPDIRACNNCSASNNHLIINNSGITSNINKITRDVSAPNLNSYSSDFMKNNSLQVLRANGRSLESILESEETISLRDIDERVRINTMRGAIPKNCRRSSVLRDSKLDINDSRMEEGRINDKIPASKTYFCLKSILKKKKQNKRRYTLVTTEELKYLNDRHEDPRVDDSETVIFLQETPEKRRWVEMSEGKRDNPYRTLIFASPIHEVCRSNDPFIVDDNGKSQDELPDNNISDLPVLTRLGRSLTVLSESELPSTTPHNTNNTNSNSNSNNKRKNKQRSKHHRTLSIEPEYLQFFTSSDDTSSPFQQSTSLTTTSNTNNFVNNGTRLTRSLTERRSKTSIRDKFIRRSFTDERTDFGSKRINFSLETSL
ncbi:probable serine/threonine-protein kinase ndrD [Microplitis mediator]|uniref:probable serine/threonine-protein kinase ndrD n=1 Tax=Microplitis mediator TaxID=375433 RepID=UPI002552D135|nr:probable serine/threonine-protein kinase ndrD [Microplitis mediator]